MTALLSDRALRDRLSDKLRDQGAAKYRVGCDCTRLGGARCHSRRVAPRARRRGCTSRCPPRASAAPSVLAGILFPAANSQARSVTRTNDSMAAGAAWMVGFKVTERALTLVSTLILARILVPADFGVVAMAMSIVATLEVLTSFSMDVAIIQRADVDRGHLDTAWTFNLIFGAAIALALVVLARPAAEFYRNPQLVPVMCVLGVGWLAQGAREHWTRGLQARARLQEGYLVPIRQEGRHLRHHHHAGVVVAQLLGAGRRHRGREDHLRRHQLQGASLSPAAVADGRARSARIQPLVGRQQRALLP